MEQDSLIKRILNFFRQGNQRSTPSSGTGTAPIPTETPPPTTVTGGNTETIIEPTEKSIPGEEPVIEPTKETDPLMINTLSLSTDQEKLYLIDNDRCVDFSLTTANGVTIGTLGGQLSIVSTQDSPKLGDESTDGTGEIPRKIRVATDDKTQWTFFFNEDAQILGLIGASDIDISISETPKTQVFIVDLKTKIVTLKRAGILLELTIFSKEPTIDDGGGTGLVRR